MRKRICLFAVTPLILCLGPPAHAQASPSAVEPAAQPSQGLETVPRVPGIATFFRGFNAGINYSGVHNSSAGWYSVATPAVNYTFSRHFSGDASASLYFGRQVQSFDPATGSTILVADSVDASDSIFGFHASFRPAGFQNVTSASLSAPTGDRSAGLGTGRVTFDFTNHTERYYRRLGLLVDLGGGDSSGLFNSMVSRDYNSLGALAHFLAGAAYWFRDRAYIESVLYEQLPIGGQKVYSDVPAPPGSQPPPPVLTGGGVSEDNGVTTFVGAPISPNITFSSYYNRSLRQHQDTVSFGFTYVLHGSHNNEESLVDRALREAEKPSQ